MELPASVVLLTRSNDLQNDWRLQMCKYISRMGCIVLFHRRLPTTTLEHKCMLALWVLFQSSFFLHAHGSRRRQWPPCCHGNCRRFPVLPARHFIHTVVGRRAYQRLRGNIDQSCVCWGVRTAVGDNDPGSVGAPALLGSAVEPETSLQIYEKQQFEEVKRSSPRNPSGGRAQHRRRGTCFSCSGSYCIQQRCPILLSCCHDRIGRPTFPPIREPSFSQRNQTALGSNPRHPFNQVFPPAPVVIKMYTSCPYYGYVKASGKFFSVSRTSVLVTNLLCHTPAIRSVRMADWTDHRTYTWDSLASFSPGLALRFLFGTLACPL